MWQWNLFFNRFSLHIKIHFSSWSESFSTSCTETDQSWPGSDIQQPPVHWWGWHSVCYSRPHPRPPPAPTTSIINSSPIKHNINNPLHYRVLHPGLVVVGVGLGSHLEVEGPEGGLGEDGVVPDFVPLVSLPELLWTDTKNLLCTFLKITKFK